MNGIIRIASVIALGGALLAGSAGTAVAAAQPDPPSRNTHSGSASGPGSTATTGSPRTTPPNGSPQKPVDSVPIPGTGTTSAQCDYLFGAYNSAVDNLESAINSGNARLERIWGDRAAELARMLSKHCIVIYTDA